MHLEAGPSGSRSFNELEFLDITGPSPTLLSRSRKWKARVWPVSSRPCACRIVCLLLVVPSYDANGHYTGTYQMVYNCRRIRYRDRAVCAEDPLHGPVARRLCST
jgi:hypothetical protein